MGMTSLYCFDAALYDTIIKVINMYLKQIFIDKTSPAFYDSYVSSIPSISSLDSLEFNSPITFFIGENGSGKSTLLEAIAVKLGFNPEGGTKNFNFSTSATHSSLTGALKTVRTHKTMRDGFFLRAESYYNVATKMEELDSFPSPAPTISSSYGGSPHEKSHGESFLDLVLHRFGGHGLYILDEPEAALSPTRQMALLSKMNELVNKDSQFIIATHSPIIMAYPGSSIYSFEEDGLKLTDYKETENYFITKSFLNNPERMFRELFD